MDDNFFSLDISSGWVLLIFLLAAGLSIFLYSKKNIPWHQNINMLLGFLRFSALLLLGILLLNPIMKLSVNEEDEPVFVVVMDNSESIPMRMGEQQLKQLVSTVEGIQQNLSDYQVTTYNLTGRADSLNFKGSSSNLSSIFNSFESIYDGKNVGGILFLSDGIYNEGLSPAYLNYRYPIYTVGLGDTIPPRDISIRDVRHNRVAYQGNKFPVTLKIEQRGFTNEVVNVSVNKSGKSISSQNIRLTDHITDVSFELEAQEAGLMHLIIRLPQKEGESTYENNRKDIFIEVIEGKEKVLVISPVPHPDIKAIRQTLHETGNYETVLYIPGITKLPTEKNYDVIIEYSPFKQVIRHSFKSTGKWIILDSRSQVDQIYKSLPYLRIRTRSTQKDLVRPTINPTFRKFQLDSDQTDRFNQYPPTEVHFGDYVLSGATDVLLYQKVGSVNTTKPMMFFYDDGSEKSAVTIGTGIWQWKLQEAAVHGDDRLFNELVLKTVQFLSIRTNKKRFTATPRQNVYREGDRIFVDTQVYNEIFERSYGNKINLSITNEAGETRNYELVDSPLNSTFSIGTLKQGIYKYRASVVNENEQLVDRGEFLVEALQVEALDLTANHNLLREMSHKSNGAFFHFSEIEALTQALENTDFQSIIRTRESYFPLISSLWIIIAICFFLFSEWFLRKYLGMY
ncbi:MAG: hypothetical protein KI791_18810 [Cyclobacteriaceae bacterium]|nr:hypothetical protein [Cyclobacteriaceae bacterium SS2]